MDPTSNPEQYAEAMEQADAGIRLALPRFAQMIGVGKAPAPGPSIDHEQAKTVASDLMTARGKVFDAAKNLALEGNADLHLRFNGLLNEIDAIGAELADRWQS